MAQKGMLIAEPSLSIYLPYRLNTKNGSKYIQSWRLGKRKASRQGEAGTGLAIDKGCAINSQARSRLQVRIGPCDHALHICGCGESFQISEQPQRFVEL